MSNIENLSRLGLVVELGFLSVIGGGSTINSKVQGDIKNNHSQQNCAIPIDCPNPSEPYCNIYYPLRGSNNPSQLPYGLCEANPIQEPLQITSEDECPTGTLKQLIYPNEGTEAVCL